MSKIKGKGYMQKNYLKEENMKKAMAVLVVGMILFFLPIKVNAIGISASIKGGAALGLTNFTFVGMNRTINMGLNGGLSIGISPTDLIEMEIGANYVQKGGKWTLDMAGITGETYMLFDYLTIPVLLKVAPMSGGMVKPYVLAGFSAGIVPISAKMREKSELGPIKLDTTIDIKEDMDVKMDYGIVGGIGTVLNLGSLSPFIEAGIDLGMADIMGVAITTTGKEQTRTFFVNLGLKYRIK